METLTINILWWEDMYSVVWVLQAALQHHQCLGVISLTGLSSMMSWPVFSLCLSLSVSLTLSFYVCLCCKDTCVTFLSSYVVNTAARLGGGGLTITSGSCHWWWLASVNLVWSGTCLIVLYCISIFYAWKWDGGLICQTNSGVVGSQVD